VHPNLESATSSRTWMGVSFSVRGSTSRLSGMTDPWWLLSVNNDYPQLGGGNFVEHLDADAIG
jgi:hypothetical protein